MTELDSEKGRKMEETVKKKRKAILNCRYIDYEKNTFIHLNFRC